MPPKDDEHIASVPSIMPTTSPPPVSATPTDTLSTTKAIPYTVFTRTQLRTLTLILILRLVFLLPLSALHAPGRLGGMPWCLMYLSRISHLQLYTHTHTYLSSHLTIPQ